MVASTLDSCPVVVSDTIPDTRSGLTREMLVDRIQAINPGASAEYLLRFDGLSLALYLEHLTATSVPRGRGARWLRPGDTAGILGFVPAPEA